MIHLRLFDEQAVFETEKENLVEPWVALTTDNGVVHYMASGEPVDEDINYLYMSYGYDLDPWGDGTRMDYVSEYEYDNKVYYKFAYSYINEEFGERVVSTDDDLGFVLVSTRNFKSLTYPYAVEILQGYDYGEGNVYIYPFVYEWNNVDLYGFATEQPNNTVVIAYHDTSSLNTNNHEYVDLGLPSGTLWARYNVGATAETEYGDYFMWGDVDPATNKNCDWEHYKYGDGFDFTKYNTGLNGYGGKIDDKVVLDLEDDGVRVKMGGDWKIPSRAQFDELIKETGHEWVENYQNTGVNGRLFTSKTNGNTMFIPASGFRRGSSFYYRDYNAYLWCGLLSASYPDYAWVLSFYSDNCSMGDYNRCNGFVLRGAL